jgi:hypothetical protein
MTDYRGRICSICKKRKVVYEKVKHCKECHANYARENHAKHNRRNQEKSK